MRSRNTARANLRVQRANKVDEKLAAHPAVKSLRGVVGAFDTYMGRLDETRGIGGVDERRQSSESMPAQAEWEMNLCNHRRRHGDTIKPRIGSHLQLIKMKGGCEG